MARIQSPCIGVCKYRRPGPAGAHCIACSMTKAQKKSWKRLKKLKLLEGFVALVAAQQQVMGGFSHWRAAYQRRCLKKGRQPAEIVRRAAPGTQRSQGSE